jgi:MoaA/NifB/PqqE/SkfB family radical SAM enzyme
MPHLGLIRHYVRSFVLLRLRWERVYLLLGRIEQAFFGRKVRIEVCSKCQLGCPSCATAQGVNRSNAVGWGSLSPRQFENFLEQNRRIRSIEISSWGEIFLNPKLPEILKIAHDHHVAVTARNGVNLNSASEEMLEALVLWKVRFVSVSIDGATNETYSIYRIHGNLERVIRNVDRINHYKELHRAKYPVLQWQYVIFGHNEHEIAAARAMAEGRGMQFAPIRNLDPDRSPLKNPELVQIQTGIPNEPDQAKALAQIGRSFMFCQQFWDDPQINWDGKLLGCCFNNATGFGNVFESGLETALRNPDYAYTRKMLLGSVPPRNDSPCMACPVFPGTPGGRKASVHWTPQKAADCCES